MIPSRTPLNHPLRTRATLPKGGASLRRKNLLSQSNARKRSSLAVRRRLDLDGRFRNESARCAYRLDAHDERSSAAASRLRESEAAAIAPARTLPVRRATVRQDRMARQDRLNGTLANLAGLVGFAHTVCAGLFPFGAVGTGGLPGNAASAVTTLYVTNR